MKKTDYITLSLIIMLFASVSLLFFAERSLHGSENAVSIDDGETVVIDAGHGGEDGGAVGIGDVLEKDLNLKISRKLKCIMMLLGVDAVMTRDDDVSLSGNEDKLRERKVSDMRARVNTVNNISSATLVSIHQNSFGDSSCSGAQVFFSDGNAMSKALADSVQSALKFGVDKNNKRIAKCADKNIFILQKANCPAVLVECGFITNEKEADLLKSDIYQTKISVCVAAGYLKYKSEM